MKKNIYPYILIAVTTLSVNIMLYSNNTYSETSIEKPKLVKQVPTASYNSNDIKNDMIEDKKIRTYILREKRKKEYDENAANKQKISNDKKINTSVDSGSNQNKVTVPDENGSLPYKNENVQSVFKVAKKNIVNSLSMADKLDLLFAASKLKQYDMDKIKSDLSLESIDSIKDAFSILKSKLPNDDYEKVMKIASKYINTDIISEK